MTEEYIIELVNATLVTVSLLAAPPLIVVVVVGIVANVLQTVTQIRDPALAFIPKMVAVGIITVLTIPWQLQIMRQYTETIFELVGSVGQ